MSVWVTQEGVRWALRFYGRRCQWTQRSLLPAASVQVKSSSSQVAHVWDKRQNQTCLARSHVSPVRFYSQDSVHGKNLEETSEVQSVETTSRETQKNPFFDALISCSSPSDVLDLTCEQTPPVRMLSKCLHRMWKLTKTMSHDQLHYERQLMFEHPAFEELLNTVLKSLPKIMNRDLVYSLLCMINLGVPQQSLVIQTLVRTCQERLNSFDEKCLSMLASCLENMESCHNVDVLKQGMRLIVETRLPKIESVVTLQTMMRMLGKDAPWRLKQKLQQKALSMSEQFTLANSQYMISTMVAMDLNYKPLLNVCCTHIRENLHVTSFTTLIRLLLECKTLKYRDFELLTSMSEYVSSSLDIWTDKQLLLFLSAFEDLAFCPAPLMETYAKKVIANPDMLKLQDLLCILKVYSSLNYDLQHHRQQFLDSVSQVLDSYLPKLSGFKLLKSVYTLCQMGHFPPAPLEQLLNSCTTEQESTAPSAPVIQKMFQTVDLCLRLDRPPLPRPLTVPPSVLEGPTPDSPFVNPALSEILQSMVGDQPDIMLQETVMVENHYLINGVITKRTSETGLSNSAGEELSPAGSSQRFAVICPPASEFCYGTSRPRGPLGVKLRHLKILGYNPVLVRMRELLSLPEEERVQFLRGQIFPECHRSDARPEVEQLPS